MDSCVICGRREFKPLWRELKQCTQCGHTMANIDTTTFEPTKHYNEAYFSGDEYADYLRDQRTMERHFNARLKEVRRYHSNGELIEIGCAYGFFLNLAREFFSVRGFDIAESAVAHARDVLGLQVEAIDFLEAPLDRNSASVIVMWDTIEHLIRPDLVVNKAAQVLHTGGSLFLTTGDIGSFLARTRRETWRLIHPPTHLHYFNQESISRLLENSGFEISEIKHVPVWRSVRQIMYSLLVLGKQSTPLIYRWIENSRIGDLSFPLNTMDIMLVVGRRHL